jgi:UDP-N-acetylmuramyl pentapeptide phosphotransferase/UDP-N-acetylglucosamine-1-phosphate transferase
LWYNYAPAKIYMGDTGSMFIGFTIVYLSLKYIHHSFQSTETPTAGSFAPSVVMVLSLVLPPMLDALRVFALRMSKGISPLKADRLHLHYYLLDAGLGHAAAAWVLILVHLVTLAIGIWLVGSSIYIAGVAILLPTLVLTYMATLAKKKHQKLGA